MARGVLYGPPDSSCDRLRLRRLSMVRAVSLLLVGLSCGLLSTNLLQAAEPVLALELQSGRRFAGDIDAQSGDQSLVLRVSKGGMTIRRPIRWERIVSATLEG